MLIAQICTKSLIDRSLPRNIIETSTDDDVNFKSIDSHNDIMLTEHSDDIPQKLSLSSSLTSGADIYMNVVDIFNDDKSDNKRFDRFYI